MTALRALWLTDPRDGKTHAFRHVVTGGLWLALCPGFVAAAPATLTEPEDVFGHCVECETVLALPDLIKHGTQLADQMSAQDNGDYLQGF